MTLVSDNSEIGGRIVSNIDVGGVVRDVLVDPRCVGLIHG